MKCNGKAKKKKKKILYLKAAVHICFGACLILQNSSF